MGYVTIAIALPQGATARYYFQHGASFWDESPKQVITQILANTDKESFQERLKAEIGKKISLNRYSEDE
ncbi:hypothetical protein [Bythopirellula goksoeyrii]|uniref:hypothetical protein n=1 Tax=Bythopirellula goksoeyrii TaxID=1400387 RepID=UPI0011CECF3C|nr:hypothetical protein [Bythopirellula goksoeyrii]